MEEAYSKTENETAWLAWQLISETSSSIFLTGKAGTGKTTFLHKLNQLSPKRMAIVAPTGVAAINAGGVTIHSFFQLPFAPFVPGSAVRSDYVMRAEKIKIIRTLDLLVIDEISMVRADLLDAVDATLRHYRRNEMPFGGVQLLLIGDLQQLPPVVVEAEREVIETNYSTPYFFGSKALQQLHYITIELDKVYRQNDENFVALLNKIRNNQTDQNVLDALNARYIEGFDPADSEGYIRLTTHNNQADNINSMKLLKLKQPDRNYECEVEGNFPENSYPADKVLKLKIGAQVMFIKNDKQTPRRFYNGKIGEVIELKTDSVIVRCIADDQTVEVPYDEWTNVRYVINKQTNEISEHIDGVFKQIPLRLAWAVTIHKSQGLTFDKVVIDAHQAFAHGQVYVALSRCRTLEGIVLSSLITPHSVISDSTVSAFMNNCEGATEEKLNTLKSQYSLELIKQLFSFRILTSTSHRIERIVAETQYKTMPKLIAELNATLSIAENEITQVAEKFISICNYNYANNGDIIANSEMMTRVSNGAKYFATKIESLIGSVYKHTDVDIDRKETAKQLSEQRVQLYKDMQTKLAELKYVAQNGFNTKEYLKVRAKALLDSEKSEEQKSNTKNNIRVSDDVEHKELYSTIKKWRKDKAEELEVPAYHIITQKTLVDLVAKLPQSIAELRKVNGIGKAKSEQFGTELLEMIANYLKNNK